MSGKECQEEGEENGWVGKSVNGTSSAAGYPVDL